jgi:hypothetical protein
MPWPRPALRSPPSSAPEPRRTPSCGRWLPSGTSGRSGCTPGTRRAAVPSQPERSAWCLARAGRLPTPAPRWKALRSSSSPPAARHRLSNAAWIAPGSYVTTLGPKQQGRAEFGLDLPDAASLLVTDSLDQIGAYRPPNVLVGTPHRQRLVSLGAVRAGEVPVPGADQVSLFFSVGLAGTEAFLLNRLAARIEAKRR